MSLRTAMIALAATAMIGTQTMAAEVAPLTAGKPAGVHKAQSSSPSVWVLLGAGAVVVGAIVIASVADDYEPCTVGCVTPGTSSTGTN